MSLDRLKAEIAREKLNSDITEANVYIVVVDINTGAFDSGSGWEYPNDIDKLASILSDVSVDSFSSDFNTIYMIPIDIEWSDIETAAAVSFGDDEDEDNDN